MALIDGNLPLEKEKEKTLNNILKVGYVVGLTPDGKFLFEVVGEDPTLLELLGLQTYAAKQIELVLNNSLKPADKE